MTVKKNQIEQLRSELETLNKMFDVEKDEVKKNEIAMQVDEKTKALAELSKEAEAAKKEIGPAKEAEKAKKEVVSTKKLEEAKKQLAIMDRYKVDEIYSNPSGAYFTNKNLAELSVPEKKDVKVHTREIVESIVKS